MSVNTVTISEREESINSKALLRANVITVVLMIAEEHNVKFPNDMLAEIQRPAELMAKFVADTLGKSVDEVDVMIRTQLDSMRPKDTDA